MTAYRVDQRFYQGGDIIIPSSSEDYSMRDDYSGIENILEKKKPVEKPSRAGPLYLYADEEDALRHWITSSSARTHLYEVEIDSGDLLHRGDVGFIDLGRRDPQSDPIEKLAAMYWSGVTSEKPKIELLVSKARVTKMIKQHDNGRRSICRKILDGEPIPEDSILKLFDELDL